MGLFGVVAATCLMLVGNDYRFTQVAVEIPTAQGHLNGVLTLPAESREPRGVVVMVHGDGPADANQNGLLSPWFESAADAGFATLSWSKPGVSGSSGNWLDQSMQDRATEVEVALDWAIAQPHIPTDRIVLWGASQAGWVVPKVVAARHDIDAVVAVGTAINWHSQGRYNLLAELDHSSATSAQRTAALATSDTVNALLRRGATHEEYLAATPEDDPMDEQRWRFVMRNMDADATADLRASANRGIPILLLAGQHDRNVDVAETERVYRGTFGAALSVHRVDAVHSMARPIVGDNELVGTVVGVFWPRAVFPPEVMDAYGAFLAGV